MASVCVGFNRMRPFNTSIAIILIIMLFVVRSYKDYLEKELKDSHVPDDKISKESNKVGNAEMVILLGLITNIIIGAYVYWDDHKPKDADAFDFAKFMIGTPDCKRGLPLNSIKKDFLKKSTKKWKDQSWNIQVGIYIKR